MMQIWICEDDAMYRASIQQKIKNWSIFSGISDVETTVFHSSEDLWEKWTSGFTPHLILLDIEIPNELSGLEIARRIRAFDTMVPIVFITNYSEYACQGYTVNALRYLKKPIHEAELFPCLDIAYRHYILLHQDCSILSLSDEHVVLRYAEILYIEAHSPNIEIKLVNNLNSIVVRYRLSRLAEHLPPELFSFCHRSYIVNLAQIRTLRKSKLILCNDECLPISEKYADELIDRFNKYHQKGHDKK